MLGKDARLCVRGSGSRRPASAFSAAQVPSGLKGRAAWSHPRPRPFRARLPPAPPVRLDCPAGNCARPAGVGRAPRPVSMETACQPPNSPPAARLRGPEARILKPGDACQHGDPQTPFSTSPGRGGAGGVSRLTKGRCWGRFGKRN